MPEFTQDWFSAHIPNWKRWLADLAGRDIAGLEVGCFEGRSTVWLLENVFTSSKAQLTCVDTFQGSEEHQGIDFRAVLRNFRKNTETWADKVFLRVGKSADVLRGMTGEQFSFVYVDGSHQAADVLADAVLLWPLVAKGGIVIFDDYRWQGCPGWLHNPRPGIDAFLDIFSAQYETIAREYQVAIRKL